ncbi:MAG TPA: O-antigen ligase family protein [Burkholderiales bacterium]|nr:O-antigen ligase family protein [Burkholderiales bacterium]
MTPGRRVEVGALLALAMFLPLYEAPKSIAWLVYIVAWLANRARRRDFGGPWDLWDTLIAAWIASGWVVAAFAGLDGSQWRGAVDLARYGAVLWLLKRSDYSMNERRWVFLALVASVALGLALGHWRLWHELAEFLELNSVGHVNHTAIYCAVMLGACAAWLFSGGGALAAGMVVVLLISLVVSASRAGIGVALAMLLVLAAAWWPRSRRPLVAALVLIAATVAFALVGQVEVVRKHQRNVEQQNVLAYRDGIWRAALVAWQRYPLFGIGMDNYGRVKLDDVKRWRTEAGKPFDARDYSEFPHAHSVYLNTLAERGLVGALAFAAVMAAWLAALWRRRPSRQATDDECLWWGGAASAWMITAGVGLVNTTLHHEHGILAMLFLGLWLSCRRQLNSG